MVELSSRLVFSGAAWFWLVGAGAFPAFHNPETLELAPQLPAAARLCAQLSPIVDAQLVSYNEVVRGAYTPPTGCPGGIQWAVLEVHGFVKGVQFDRYGGLWFRGVEVLRTTTPEPSPEGITWRIVKDVSAYARLFGEAGEFTLTIPNIVSDVYTGRLHINVSVDLYDVSAAHSETPPPPLVIIPLRNLSSVRDPFSQIATRGMGQVNFLALPRDTLSIHLDLYASGHGCEEFWYVNPLEAPAGGCGGGAYRELVVLIDGVVAGVHYPFPVLYTGGVNPMLWRPLAGIRAFDIPAYEFDLTPFAAWLSDGRSHNITLTVTSMNPLGTWYMDGVLRIQQDPDGGVQGGSVNVLSADGPVVFQSMQSLPNAPEVSLQSLEATRKFHVRGTLLLASGREVLSEVFTKLTARSSIRDVDDTTTVTEGLLHTLSQSVRDGQRCTVESKYPFHLLDDERQDSRNISLELNTSVRYGLSSVHTMSTLSDSGRWIPSFAVSFYHGMEGRAFINLTEATHRLSSELADMHGKFRVWMGAPLPPLELDERALGGGGLCCQRRVAAGNGSILVDEGECRCTWPSWLYACGDKLCGALAVGTRTAARGIEVAAFAEPPGSMGQQPVEFDTSATLASARFGEEDANIFLARRPLRLRVQGVGWGPDAPARSHSLFA